MKKNIFLFYLFILTVAVKEPCFAKEKSTFASSICRDQLIANLPDQVKDILSGAIIIAQHLRPSNPQVDLYHIFLSAMTEVRVDGGPITYTNSDLLTFLRKQNLLEDFQNFLLDNLGLKGDQIGSLFEKKSDGTLIFNTDKPLDHSFVSDFSNYTPAASRLLTIITQKRKEGIPRSSDDFFLYVLNFNNPIRDFFFSHLTSTSFLERTIGRLFRWITDPMRSAEVIFIFMISQIENSSLEELEELEKLEKLTDSTLEELKDSSKKSTSANSIFDLINKFIFDSYPIYLAHLRISYLDVDLSSPELEEEFTRYSKYVSEQLLTNGELVDEQNINSTVEQLSQYFKSVIKFFNIIKSIDFKQFLQEEFIKVLEQQSVDDFNRFIRIETNDTYVYGKIIGFSKDDKLIKPDLGEYETSVIIESLGGQRYTYSFYRDRSANDSFLFMEGDAKSRDDFSFVSSIRVKNVSISGKSKGLFSLYEKIRSSIGYPMPLNQDTPDISVNLFRKLFNLIALNHYLREHHPELGINQVFLSDFNKDRHFVSFLNWQGERVPGKLIEINGYNGVTIEDLNGQRIVIEGEALNTIFQDISVRFLFQYPLNVSVLEVGSPPVVQREGEGASYAQLEMSGDPTQDAFRKALIAGRFEGDERFISFLDLGERRLAKIVSWEKDKITLQVYRGNGGDHFLKELSLVRIENFEVAVSRAAKGYFERNDHLLNERSIRVMADEDYQFLSRSIPTVTSQSEAIEMTVDLTDSDLKKWMRRATDIIREKTGITPGPQNLTAAQRIQIYRVFHNDIVPLIKRPEEDRFYDFYFLFVIPHSNHDRVDFTENSDRKNVFRYLSYALDTKSAVCAELSAFGVVLFSEYGLHAKYMVTSPQVIEMEKKVDDSEHVRGHAWIGVRREDGSLEFIDTTGRIFWSTNLRLLREHYSSLSHLSDEQLLSLSDEYTLVIPPSSE